MVKLNGVYKSGSPTPTTAETTSRTLPDNVKIVNISGALDPSPAENWMVSPTVAGQTRTLEFNTDGSMRFYQAVSGSTCVLERIQVLEEQEREREELLAGVAALAKELGFDPGPLKAVLGR